MSISLTTVSDSSHSSSTSTESPGSTSRGASRSSSTNPANRRSGSLPDFYLPDDDMYVEITTMNQKLVTKKNRKVRQLRRPTPRSAARSSTSGITCTSWSSTGWRSPTISTRWPLPPACPGRRRWSGWRTAASASPDEAIAPPRQARRASEPDSRLRGLGDAGPLRLGDRRAQGGQGRRWCVRRHPSRPIRSHRGRAHAAVRRYSATTSTGSPPDGASTR
jgi:hypothetical protein